MIKIWTGATDTDWNTAGNFQTEAGAATTVPTTGDDVTIQGAVNIETSLDGITALLGSLTVLQSYIGTIGGHAAGIDEPLEIQATVLEIGNYEQYGSPLGSGRIAIANTAATQTTTIFNSKNSAIETQLPPIRLYLKGTTACTVHAKKGRILLTDNSGVGAEAAAEIDIVHSAFVSSPDSDVQLSIQNGVTLGAIEQTGGDLKVACGTTSYDVLAGTTSVTGNGAHADLNVSGGQVAYNSNGTITALHVGNASSIDFTKDTRAKTVTACTLAAGATVKADTNVTWTGGLDLDPNVKIENITLEGFTGVTLSV